MACVRGGRARGVAALDRALIGLLWLVCLPLLSGQGVALALDPAHHVSEYSVTAWTMQDGLPHNFVQAIAQDRDGYLWVGTWAGAARFNGREFTLFDEHAMPGIPLAGVRVIARDTDGALLFGTSQYGVVRFDRGVWSRVEPTVTRGLRVVSLARVGDGSLWVGTDRTIWRLQPDGSIEDMAAHGLPQGTVLALLDLGDDGVLVGGDHGVFRWRDGRFEDLGRQHHVAEAPIRALLRRRDGSLAVAGNAGVFLIEGEGRARQILFRQTESLLEDRDGSLWIGVSAGGLVRYADGRLEAIDGAQGFLGRNSQALLEDREGLLWVGTTNGLFRVNDAPAFGLDTRRGLGDNYPRAILRDTDGAMVVGHARGMDRWTGDRFEPVALEPEESSVLALGHARDGGLWLGTYDQGVLYLPPGRDAHAAPIEGIAGLPSHHVRAVRETADGSLWIGTTAGLVRRHPDGRMERIADSPGRSDSFIRGLAPASDGGLWIALGNGLMHWHPDERFERWMSGDDYPGIGSLDVLEIAPDDVFIGGDRGLLRLRDGRFRVYGREHGLPVDALFRVLRDARGMLWMCGNRGAYRVDPRELDEVDAGRRSRVSVDVLDQSSGMPSSQCNGGSAPAGDLDDTGRLWFPTALGVAVIDPEAVSARAQVSVPLRIEDVVVDGEVQAQASRYVIEPSANRVVVNYVGLHLRDPRGVRYRYRLSGFDRDWVDAGNALQAVYTNLPPGRLRFEVQAALAPVDWDAMAEIPTATLELERIPPYWRRPWFYALFPLAALLLSLGWFLWRSARYQRRQRVLMELVDVRTRELMDKNEALQRAGIERESLLRQLAHQARHDMLTGIANRRAGEERLQQAVQQADASDAPLCIALLDVDRFKRINDAFGHDAGDAVLRRLAVLLGDADFIGPHNVARYGGEEFLLLLPGHRLAGATEKLAELVARIAATKFMLDDGRGIDCTVSIGVVEWQPGMSPGQAVVQADRRLYRAKQLGRNRVEAGD